MVRRTSAVDSCALRRRRPRVAAAALAVSGRGFLAGTLPSDRLPIEASGRGTGASEMGRAVGLQLGLVDGPVPEPLCPRVPSAVGRLVGVVVGPAKAPRVARDLIRKLARRGPPRAACISDTPI